MAIEVVPLFTIQDAWNKLPTVDPGAVLAQYEGAEVKGVPESTSRGLCNVKNKDIKSGEQSLTPPFLPSLEATPTPAQNTLA
jgi:hypothetical protein